MTHKAPPPKLHIGENSKTSIKTIEPTRAKPGRKPQTRTTTPLVEIIALAEARRAELDKIVGDAKVELATLEILLRDTKADV